MLYKAVISTIMLIVITKLIMTSDCDNEKTKSYYHGPHIGNSVGSLKYITGGSDRCRVYKNGRALDFSNGSSYDIERVKGHQDIQISTNCLLLLTVYRSTVDQGLDLKVHLKKKTGRFIRKPDFSLLEMDAIENDSYIGNTSAGVKCLDNRDQQITNWRLHKNVPKDYFNKKLSRCFVTNPGSNQLFDPNIEAWTMVGRREILSQERRDGRNMISISTLIPHGSSTEYGDRTHTILRAISLPMDQFMYIKIHMYDLKRSSYLFSGRVKKSKGGCHVPP